MKRKKKNDFNLELEEKINDVCRERIYDPQQDKVVLVAEARADILLNKTSQIAERNKAENLSYRSADKAAADYQIADSSDPFAYRRARCHILSGVCAASDYGARIKYKRIEYQGTDGKTHQTIERQISNIKRC